MEDPYPSFALIFLMQSASIWFYLLDGVILIGLLSLSALASGSEVAFFALTNQQILDCKSSDARIEKMIFTLISEPQKLLATILILNNFVNVGIVTLSTFVTWNIFGTSSLEGIIIVILTFLVTFIIVFFGEITPKVYANQNALKVAKKTAPLIYLSGKIFTPVSWFCFP